MKIIHTGNLYLVVIGFILFGLAGCAENPESCPPPVQVDLSETKNYYNNPNVPFQFPLDDPRFFQMKSSYTTEFAGQGSTPDGFEYHAAEDGFQPAGSPVFAMADGKVSFSGPMGGYGWLIIIDHPQANIYSLYGHLSPSRWSIKKGPVQKGELIGYLGDSDENGGSKEYPLITHLHFGVRVGQRADYPGNREWRWMAGWIRQCPQDLGWLQPSLVIESQDLKIGDSYDRNLSFLSIWWFDILFLTIYLFGGSCMFIFAIKKKKPIILFISGIALFGAGWIFRGKGMNWYYILFLMSVVFILISVYQLIRNRKKSWQPKSN